MRNNNMSQNKFQVNILIQKLEEYQEKEQECLKVLESVKIDHDLILESINSIKNQINNIDPSFNPDNEGKNLLLEEKDNLVIEILSRYSDEGLTMPEVKNVLDKEDKKIDGKLLTIDELTGCRKRLLESERMKPHPSCVNKKRFVKYIVNEDV